MRKHKLPLERNLTLAFVTAPSLDTSGWSAAALAQIEKIQQKERERQKKEEDMRQLQLKATSSKKRPSDEVPEQLEKRVPTTNTVTLPRAYVRVISVQKHGAQSGETL